MTFEEKFWSKVDKSGKCWEWQGAINAQGYGIIYQNCVKKRAHRLSYTFTYGDIPDGLFACHECDNRKCVRPDHIFLGTAADNWLDCRMKGRNKPIPLESITQRKLTADQVREMRVKHAAGTHNYNQLAREYGVRFPTIIAAVKRKTWKYVE